MPISALIATTTACFCIAGALVLFAVTFVPQEPYGGWPVIEKIAMGLCGIALAALVIDFISGGRR